jgi:hypothetical protein
METPQMMELLLARTEANMKSTRKMWRQIRRPTTILWQGWSQIGFLVSRMTADRNPTVKL